MFKKYLMLPYILIIFGQLHPKGNNFKQQIIACLGLFGLVTYAAEQRTKEIGIRKVLGATVSQVVGLLSKDLLKLVLIAVIIAFPISWWGMSK